jgi:hypothetical protein
VDSLDNTYFRDLANNMLGWHQTRLDETHVQ